MTRFALPLIAVASLAAAAPATAAEVQIAAQGPVVELTVTETVKAKPDIATVGAGVTSQAQTAVEAMRLNAQAMDKVIQRIKAMGIEPNDIQTVGINLGAQYDYDQARRQQVFRGYQASNRVSVTLREVKKVGAVLDALVAAGATDINGPDFSLDDDSGPRSQARKAAFDAARDRANEYARWTGYTGVRLLEVSESVSSSRPIPLAAPRAEFADAKATPIEPGQVGTEVNLTVKYEMTR